MGSTVTSVRHKEHQLQHNEGVATAESGKGQSSSGQRRTPAPVTRPAPQLFTRSSIKKLSLYPEHTPAESRKGQQCLVSGEHTRLFTVHSTKFVTEVTAGTFTRDT